MRRGVSGRIVPPISISLFFLKKKNFLIVFFIFIGEGPLNCRLRCGSGFRGGSVGGKRASLDKKLFPVCRPTGFKRCDCFFHVFKRKFYAFPLI